MGGNSEHCVTVYSIVVKPFLMAGVISTKQTLLF